MAVILPLPRTLPLSDAEREAGLTQPLPAGERILWQGAPDRRLLGARVFRFRLLGIYVALAMGFVITAAVQGGWPVGQAIAMALLALPCAGAGALVLALLGMLMARTTRYTLTNRRIILHIGVAYDRTISIPLSAVVDARIRPGFRGAGDIAFAVKDVGGLNYINLWPHARPWHFMPPQPSMRAVPDAEKACELIGEALVAFNTGGRQREMLADHALAVPA